MVSSEHTALRHGDQLHRRYAIREWCCVDGELTCFRVYVPCEAREGPEGFEQPDLLTADAELAERPNETVQGPAAYFPSSHPGQHLGERRLLKFSSEPGV
jgi:hypothetical protein